LCNILDCDLQPRYVETNGAGLFLSRERKKAAKEAEEKDALTIESVSG